MEKGKSEGDEQEDCRKIASDQPSQSWRFSGGRRCSHLPAGTTDVP